MAEVTFGGESIPADPMTARIHTGVGDVNWVLEPIPPMKVQVCHISVIEFWMLALESNRLQIF